jgi:hypothetical protein
VKNTSNRHLVQHIKSRCKITLAHINKGTIVELPRFNLPILNIVRNIRFIGSLLLIVTFICVSPANAYKLYPCKWPQPTTTFYVNIPGAEGLWNTSFENAMYYWGAYTIFKYKIVRGVYEDPCDPRNGRNGVGFKSTACGDAWGSTDLAITAIWYSGSTIIQSDIVFNSNESWNVYSTSWRSDVNDFQRVAVHELGHALGLDHEDSGVSTIMRSRSGDITVPQQDDISGVAAIYGGSSPPITTVPPITYVPPITTTVPPSNSNGGGGCFIATAAFGSTIENHVQILRDFRDRYLLDYKLGQKFVNFYYQASPQIAETISNSETLRLLTRWFLMPIVGAAYLTITFGIMTTLLIVTFIILSMISFGLLRKKIFFNRH